MRGTDSRPSQLIGERGKERSGRPMTYGLPETGQHLVARAARWVLKGPILVYRYTLSPLVGWRCRHVPSCSQYALDAIEINGAWKGAWLTVSRLCRCHPWGSSGLDPAPNLDAERHPFAPWRYGRWTGRHIERSMGE